MLQTLGHLKLSWVHTHPVAVKVIDEGTLCKGCMASVMPRKLSVCLVTRETICCSSDHNSYELLSAVPLLWQCGSTTEDIFWAKLSLYSHLVALYLC